MRATTSPARAAWRRFYSALLKKGAATASLRVYCFEADKPASTPGPRLGSSAVAVTFGLDNGPFARRLTSADGGASALADRAIAFVTELAGKTGAGTHAIAQPLFTVPRTFAVGGGQKPRHDGGRYSRRPGNEQVGHETTFGRAAGDR